MASGAETKAALDSGQQALRRMLRRSATYPAGGRFMREGTSMSNFDPNYAVQRGVGADRTAAEIDQGLRSYMIAVYNYMAIGVALTGVAAWLAYSMAGGDAINPRNIMATATPFGQMLYSTVGLIVMFVATFGLVMAISFMINRMSPATALGLFMLYAALLGVFLSTIFIQYTGASITRVFFISAASFGALSLYGYTTQRDLSAFGSFLMMGLIGLLLAMVVNIFWPNGMLAFIISVAGVLIFAGLTAYDTQKIKEMYDANEDGTVTGRKAVMGALTLYLDFINLFLFLLRLVGDRR
jgi:FtsH-binding integral membrane protein